MTRYRDRYWCSPAPWLTPCIWSVRDIPSPGLARPASAYVLTVACAACLLQFAVTHSIADLNLPVRVYGLGVAMAFFSTVLPAFLLAAAMHRIGSMHTSMIGSVGPVSTIYLAYVFLDEQMSLMQISGSVLVLAGVLMISLKKEAQAQTGS